MKKLLLFDVDFTLLSTGGAGKDSMVQAFKEVFGIENGFDNISMMGRTDPGILIEALKIHGIKRNEEKAKLYRSRYYELIEEKIREDRPRKSLCPGVVKLLEELSQKENLILGLLTGNWRYSAFVKLRYFGIEDHFHFGAFGGDSHDRNELVPFAVKRAQLESGTVFEPKDVFVIGDTPLDVECARPHMASTVAVATGFHSYDELKKAKPDYLFHNFVDTKAVVDVFK